MPERRGFDLGDYVEVKDRIRILFEFFPQARIETDYRLTSEPDDKPKVIANALIYRNPEDEKAAGEGHSWMYLPGSTSYTRGSEIENAETSAVGRAIGMMGILIDKSIASRQEVENKQSEDQPVAAVPSSTDAYQETEELLGDFTGTGMVRLGNDAYRLESRDGPDGHTITFRMEFKDEKAIPQVIVEGPAGEALYLACGMNAGVLRDTRLHVKGRLSAVRSNRSRQSWKRLRVTEWSNQDFTFPAAVAAEDEPALPEPPDDVELVAEAPSVPLGLVS